MVRRVRLTSKSRLSAQRGDALLEGLVGVALLGVIGLGLTFAAARIAVAQRSSNVQNLAVGQFRSLLLSNGIADGCSSTNATQTTSTDLTLAPGVQLKNVQKFCTIPSGLTVSVGGTSMPAKVPLIRFDAKSSTLFGTDDVMSLGTVSSSTK